MRKSLLLRCTAGLTFSVLLFGALGNSPVRAEVADLDDGYIAPDNADVGFLGVEFRQRDSADETFSFIGTQNFNIAACREVNGDCETLTGRVEFTAILPRCESDGQNYCIAELIAINADGTESAGQFHSFFPDRGWNDFVGDESRGVPSGGPASLWVFPGVTHVGGDQFFVRVGVSGEKVKNSYVVNTFQASITAVSSLSQQYCEEDETGLRVDPRIRDLPEEEREAEEERLDEELRARGEKRNPCSPRITYLGEPDDGRLRGRFGIGGGSGTSSSTGSDCVMRGNYQGSGVCLNRRAFSGDMKFRLVTRLGQSPRGWLHGRFAEPVVSLTPLPKPMSGVQIAITGKSITVPVVQAGMQFSELPASLQQDYSRAVLVDEQGRENWPGFRGRMDCCAMGRARLDGWETSMTRINYQSFPNAWSDHGIDELAAWLPHIGDKATANLSTWSVRTLSSAEMEGADECLKDDSRIVGLVTTNATQYSGGPPKYNRKTATLDYRVAAPHYRSGGTKFFGIYDLIMRSDVARCLYGFSKAPLNASVSVIDDEGVTTVGTRNISERNGWIQIAAYGFGFSTPTVKVKFSQGKTGVVKKTKSIVCVKGRKQRTVTGAKPICPKGFKVKR